MPKARRKPEKNNVELRRDFVSGDTDNRNIYANITIRHHKTVQVNVPLDENIQQVLHEK